MIIKNLVLDEWYIETLNKFYIRNIEQKIRKKIKFVNYNSEGNLTWLNITCLLSNTVVGDYINTMKTTFDFNFDFYKAVKQHAADTHKHKNKEKMLKKDLFDYLCTL